VSICWNLSKPIIILHYVFWTGDLIQLTIYRVNNNDLQLPYAKFNEMRRGFLEFFCIKLWSLVMCFRVRVFRWSLQCARRWGNPTCCRLARGMSGERPVREMSYSQLTVLHIDSFRRMIDVAPVRCHYHFRMYNVHQKKHPLILLAISWGIVVRF